MKNKNPARTMKRVGFYARWSQGGFERQLLKSYQADNTKPNSRWLILSYPVNDALGVKGDAEVSKLIPTLEDAYMIEVDPSVWKNVNEFLLWAYVGKYNSA